MTRDYFLYCPNCLGEARAVQQTRKAVWPALRFSLYYYHIFYHTRFYILSRPGGYKNVPSFYGIPGNLTSSVYSSMKQKKTQKLVSENTT